MRYIIEFLPHTARMSEPLYRRMFAELRDWNVRWESSWLSLPPVLCDAHRLPLMLVGFRSYFSYHPIRFLRQFGYEQDVPLFAFTGIGRRALPSRSSDFRTRVDCSWASYLTADLLGFELRTFPIATAPYQYWVAEQSLYRHIPCWHQTADEDEQDILGDAGSSSGSYEPFEERPFVDPGFLLATHGHLLSKISALRYHCEMMSRRLAADQRLSDEEAAIRTLECDEVHYLRMEVSKLRARLFLSLIHI